MGAATSSRGVVEAFVCKVRRRRRGNDSAVSPEGGKEEGREGGREKERWNINGNERKEVETGRREGKEE